MFTTVLIGSFAALFLAAAAFAASQYKRCPSDQVLVVFGKVGANKTAECIHGGGKLIIPLIQDYKFLPLKPMPIDVDLKSALSKKNIRVNVPSTFTIAISSEPVILQNAAERLLSMNTQDVEDQARDIIFGQLRLVIANMTIEEINTDRDKFLEEINTNVATELNKLGLDLINVNIKDITDESGYIEAIGRKAAAEAVQKANVDVAIQKKSGDIGVAEANRERLIQVAKQTSRTEIGEKEAEKNQRVQTAEFQAEAIAGENTSQAQVAEYNATLAEKEADAHRRGEVAKAEAARDVALAAKETEVARLQQAELAREEVTKQKVEVAAAAKAQETRLVAQGEADAILAKYKAEAEGTQKVLNAKAEGYKNLVKAVGSPELAPTLLMIEKMEHILKTQAEVAKNVKIGQVTVWDSGNNETSNFAQQFAKFSVPFQHLAKQGGVKLPEFLGTLEDFAKNDTDTPSPSGNGSGRKPTTKTK